MAVPMTSLSRAPNGDWFARKGIPKDVREAYGAILLNTRTGAEKVVKGL